MAYKTDTSLAVNSTGEIIANSITHGIGVALSIAGLVFLIIRAVNRGTGWHLAGFLVFGISLLLLYSSSHDLSLICQQALERRSAAAGSCGMIYFLIAGTYTPFLLTQSRTRLGWTVFGFIWGLSIIGLILKLGFSKKFEKPTVWLYVLDGLGGIGGIFPGWRAA